MHIEKGSEGHKVLNYFTFWVWNKGPGIVRESNLFENSLRKGQEGKFDNLLDIFENVKKNKLRYDKS